MNFWIKFEFFSVSFVKNLNPSLFQNVILSILAIFIPFAIVFLTSFLNTEKKRNEFEKMVLTDEVLGTKKIFWLSVSSVTFFAFFTGTDISIEAKFLAIIFLVISISLLSLPFRKILKFAEGNKIEFEIAFLKKLKFSKILFFRNNQKSEKMIRSWDSLWSENSELTERDFTEIFIRHIDNAIKYRRLNLSFRLAQAYLVNIEKRNSFLISDNVLPKVLEWSEQLWNERQKTMYYYDSKKRIEHFFTRKYIPISIRNWLVKIISKLLYPNDGYFGSWVYFQQEFFQGIIKTLLKNGQSQYELFEYLKKHTDYCENKLAELSPDSQQKYGAYILGIFKSFCVTFFDNVIDSNSGYAIWGYFPKEWKVMKSNDKIKASHIILDEFVQWAHQKIFKQNEDDGFDKDLTEVVNGIFPNAHTSYSPIFLVLYFLPEVKSVINKKINFYVSGVDVVWSGEKSEEDIDEMFRQKELSQREETIDIILNYFKNWRCLRISKDDISKEENSTWDKITEEKKKEIVISVRKKKLNELKDELNSEEIRAYVKESEEKGKRRTEILELVDLIIQKL